MKKAQKSKQRSTNWRRRHLGDMQQQPPRWPGFDKCVETKLRWDVYIRPWPPGWSFWRRIYTSRGSERVKDLWLKKGMKLRLSKKIWWTRLTCKKNWQMSCLVYKVYHKIREDWSKACLSSSWPSALSAGEHFSKIFVSGFHPESSAMLLWVSLVFWPSWHFFSSDRTYRPLQPGQWLMALQLQTVSFLSLSSW